MDISKSEVHGELLVEICAVASVGFHGDQLLDKIIFVEQKGLQGIAYYVSREQ